MQMFPSSQKPVCPVLRAVDNMWSLAKDGSSLPDIDIMASKVGGPSDAVLRNSGASGYSEAPVFCRPGLASSHSNSRVQGCLQ